MGVFDFVKAAGAKLFGKEEPEPAAPSVNWNDVRSKALRKAVADNGLEVADLAISVDGSQATVGGRVASQEIREKVVLCCGNTAGIARIDDRLEVETPEPEAVFYTVVSGDTLGAIAKRHYGNAMKYPVIFEANKPMLSDPDKIYPGQVLRIPPLES